MIIHKELLKYGIEILGYFTYVLLCSFTTYNPYIKSNNQDIDYLNEVKQQCSKLFENVKKAIDSIKIIEKEKINTNSKNYVLEKYLFFFNTSIIFIFLIKK